MRNKDYVPPVVEESLNKDQDTESIIYNDVINELKLSSSENKERFDYDYSKNSKYDKYKFDNNNDCS